MKEMKNKAAPAAVAVRDERAAFEAWIAKDGGDLSTFGSGQNTHYCNSAVNNAWTGWQARAAIAATPTVTGSVSNAICAATPPNVWQQAVDAEMVSAHLGIAGNVTYQEAAKALHELICWNIEVATNPQTNGGKVLVAAAAPVVLPEPDFLQRHEDVCGDEVGPPTAFYTADTVHALLATGGQALAVQHPDDVAVDVLAGLMKAKLAKQRAKGYGGWDTDCTRERLSEPLRGHVDKGDPVDVANFCAFLSARGEGIATQAAPAAVAVPDERSAFEAWAESVGLDHLKRGFGKQDDYAFVETRRMWEAWKARAAIAATPAAAESPADKPYRYHWEQLIYMDNGPGWQDMYQDYDPRLPENRKYHSCDFDDPSEVRNFTQLYRRSTAAPVVLPEQDATLLNQGVELLHALSNDERNRGNCSSAEGATASAYAVQRLAAMLATGGQAQAVETDLHGAVMNLQASKDAIEPFDINRRLAYKMGHRDARHAAAELIALHAPQAQADARDAERASSLRPEMLDDLIETFRTASASGANLMRVELPTYQWAQIADQLSRSNQ